MSGRNDPDTPLLAITRAIHNVDCDPDCDEDLTTMGRYGRYATAALDAMGETYTEWRVTGDPGEGYPPYDYVWSPERFGGADQEKVARYFASHSVGWGWRDVPRLWRREVTRSEWREVEL